MSYIKKFEEINLEDINSVGGKNAALGQMIQHSRSLTLDIPTGFAITAASYWYVIEHNGFKDKLFALLKNVDSNDIEHLQAISAAIKHLFVTAALPEDLQTDIVKSYEALCAQYHQKNLSVAVRSSATAEDLPGASFAGQQETFLNIVGAAQLLAAYKACLASLFTARAITYREQKGFAHERVALSVGVQKMVRSDKGVSGVAFSLDTETGFDKTIIINASYGLGELIVQGTINPDEYRVFKSALEKGYSGIIKKMLGSKKKRMIFKGHATKIVAVARAAQQRWSLSDERIIELSKAVVTLERYFTQLHNKPTPMDIEWAIDGIDQKLYIVQARPETVHAQHTAKQYHYHFDPIDPQLLLVEGQRIGMGAVTAIARHIPKITAETLKTFKQGDILITSMTDPDWVPLMKKASAIITDQGGRTCHAAIVSRELGIPAIIGTRNGTQRIADGQIITIDATQGDRGFVYKGRHSFSVQEIKPTQYKKPPVNLMVNCANPDTAYEYSLLPDCAGVGLARTEFIIATLIKVHPMVYATYDTLSNKKLKAYVKKQAIGYPHVADYFVDMLAYNIAQLAAPFYPRPVIVRFSDFKSNEYRHLLGGTLFEISEENPMLGLRGASRYYHEQYKAAFLLECAALKKVITQIGLTNVYGMIPFVRTVGEAQKVLEIMEQAGLSRTLTKLFMMVETPSNVLELAKFIPLFDGFSIGSNDLTQCTLGLDRDSGIVSTIADERYETVQILLKEAIKTAKHHNSYISICGQAPSDFPALFQMLVEAGIHSISLNADSFATILKH